MQDSGNSRTTGATRRKVLKISGFAGVAAIVLPTSWTKPILRAVVVPAHAQTTPGVTTTATTSVTTTGTTTTGTTTATTTTVIP